MIRTILGQDYPAAFEVIVVNEGESVEVRDTVSMFRALHNNIYLTFTPQGVVNLSRKNLRLLLASGCPLRYRSTHNYCSRYRIAALAQTHDAPLRPRRQDRDCTWLFIYRPFRGPCFRARRRAFDHVAESVRWLARQ